MVRETELESKSYWVNEGFKDTTIRDAKHEHKVNLDQEKDTSVELLTVRGLLTSIQV